MYGADLRGVGEGAIEGSGVVPEPMGPNRADGHGGTDDKQLLLI